MGEVSFGREAAALERESQGIVVGPTAPAEGSEPQRAGSRVDLGRERAALDRVRHGQKSEAIKILMEAYGQLITAFILRTVEHRETAEDLRQQVFLEAFQGIDRFQGRSSLWTWLCGIAYHRCQDELRRRKRAARLGEQQPGPEPGALGDPLAVGSSLSRRRALEQCLRKLAPEMRIQLLMRCLFEMSHAEIGELVGDSHGTVQVRMSRILPRLRKCLRGEGVDK